MQKSAPREKNRYVFEDALVHDIRMKLKRATGSYSVSRERGRIYVNVKSEDYDYEECIDALRHVFGIAGNCTHGAGAFKSGLLRLEMLFFPTLKKPMATAMFPSRWKVEEPKSPIP